eukprot:1610361-Rhodomonas_salina.4
MLFFIVRAAPPPNVTPNSFSALSVSSSFELRSCNKQQLPGPAQPDHVELAQIKRCAIKLKIRMAKRKHQNSVLARMGGEGSERQPQGAKFTRTKSDEEILSSDKGIWLFWVLITKSSLNSQLGLLVEIVLCSVHQWPYIVRDIKCPCSLRHASPNQTPALRLATTVSLQLFAVGTQLRRHSADNHLLSDAGPFHPDVALRTRLGS